MNTPEDTARLINNPAFRAFVESLRDLHPAMPPEVEIEADETGALAVVVRIPAEVFGA